MRSKIRITKRFVDEVALERNVFHWDCEVPGFGLRVHNRRRTYVFKYSTGKRGRARWMVIGEHASPWKPDEFGPTTLTADRARVEAQHLRGIVNSGGDPATDRAAARATPTLKEFWPQYVKATNAKKKPGTQRKDGHNAKRTLLPRFGNRRLDLIAGPDVERMHIDLARTPVRANRCVALISHVINIARRIGVLPMSHRNPCETIEEYPEPQRERRLTDAELGRAGAAIAAAEEEGAKERDKRTPGAPRASATAIAAIRAIAFSGARPGEIAALKRTELDLKRRRIHKLDWKTRGRTRVQIRRSIVITRPLMAVLVVQLRRIPDDSEFLFPGRVNGKPIGVSGLDGIWERIRGTIGLEDVRLSDLGRHNVGSVGADDGLTAEKIGELLGHTQPSTTRRYIHHGGAALDEAAEAIAAKVEAALGADS